MAEKRIAGGLYGKAARVLIWRVEIKQDDARLKVSRGVQRAGGLGLDQHFVKPGITQSEGRLTG